jgi:hypothetical protein
MCWRIDFRGYGHSYGAEQQNPDNAPFDRDVLAAAAFVRGNGATRGASLGTAAAGDAAIKDSGRTHGRSCGLACNV